VRRRAIVVGLLVILAAVGAAVLGLRPDRTAFHAPAGEADLARRIAQAVPASLAAHHVPGAQVALVHDGRVRWTRAFGVADARTGARMRADTPMQIASLSKVVAAYTAVRLAQAGRLSLDVPVETLTAPWRLPPSPFPARGVTLRRLLSHTAGVNVPGYLGLAPGRPLPSTAASLAGVSGAGVVRVTREPGGGWHYSGGGYTVAQLALERATGTPYAELVRRTTFAPLGMARSGFACTRSVVSGAAAGHDRDGRPMPRYRYAEQAAAGVCSTAADLARLAAAVMRTGTGRAMARPAAATGGAYGLGLHVDHLDDSTRVVWHDGANRGWQGRMTTFPDRGWAVVVLTNGDHGGQVVDDVLALLER
jgi:CubicO group peptidase (beta-lactamase class C family)